MTTFQTVSLLLLRLAFGWMFFYSGITKVMNPDWSAAGYLKGAQTMGEAYAWLMSPAVLPIVNFLNEWGQLLLGVALILGIFVRLGSILGAGLMFLYYLPLLNFPYVGKGSFLVDQHMIFLLALLVLAAFRAGRVYGLETWCSNLPICKRYPKIRAWIG